MELVLFVLLASLAPFLAASVPLYMAKSTLSPRTTQLLLAVSSGLLFAVATLDLIPEALNIMISQSDGESQVESSVSPGDPLLGPQSLSEAEMSSHSSHDNVSSLPMFGVACGFFLLLLVEQTMKSLGAEHGHSHAHSHAKDSSPELFIEFGREAVMDDLDEDNAKTKLSSSFALVASVGLAIHAFVDGLVLFGAFSASNEVGSRVGFAIVLHKLPDGFVLATVVAEVAAKTVGRKKAGIGRQMYWLMLICGMTPVGAIAGETFLADIPPAALGFVLGFGAGTFLYITCTAIIPELFEAKQFRTLSLVGLAVGYVGFALFESLVHAH